jgi:nucleotide-binding universal stress UspA family protein
VDDETTGRDEVLAAAARIGENGFAAVVAGVDGSPEAVEAARQGARLAADEATVTLVSVYTLAPPTIGATGVGVPVPVDEEAVRRASEEAVEAAAAAVGRPVEREVVAGTAWDALVGAVGEAPGALVAVGSHGIGRIAGILAGSVATEVIHRAPSSVLVARASAEGFPRKLVVGVDGSPQSAAAYAVAAGLAARFGASLWPAVAHGGKGVDLAAARGIVGAHFDDLSGDPADGLVAAAAEGDLLVVGSRGLHGLRALGSVSERVAHGAPTSVLIVRNVA